VELLVAFLIGYAVGAKAGSRRFDDVVRAARAVRDSDEFRGLLGALRTHLGATMREIANLLESEDAEGDETLVERVQRLMEGVTSRVNLSAFVNTERDPEAY
jgi:hypothetical protein